MKFKEAQEQLEHALKHQKTIGINKLKNILQSMNVSTKKDAHQAEIDYLKNELRKERRYSRQLKKRRGK